MFANDYEQDLLIFHVVAGIALVHMCSLEIHLFGLYNKLHKILVYGLINWTID